MTHDVRFTGSRRPLRWAWELHLPLICGCTLAPDTNPNVRKGLCADLRAAASRWSGGGARSGRRCGSWSRTTSTRTASARYSRHGVPQHYLYSTPPALATLNNRRHMWSPTALQAQVQDEDDIMICQCREPTFGGEGCGPNCLNYMLNIECVPVRRARESARCLPRHAGCPPLLSVIAASAGPTHVSTARRGTAPPATIATTRCSRGGRERSWRR